MSADTAKREIGGGYSPVEMSRVIHRCLADVRRESDIGQQKCFSYNVFHSLRTSPQTLQSDRFRRHSDTSNIVSQWERLG